ncbi:DUF2254 domain-containing protein [Salibacterium halotolerans]|uniref:Uncharacterized membrane protein n=1 Tax=Salibacterium halotolerans TaxID=1884432 RepID=A0A1I5RRJ7_9BACI|nr:DUF2254 domain-containing protein [Salibacterium halotolerans]SFP61164.1 Uncharacterized membrane protein [Salibacterium halotolerans]
MVLSLRSLFHNIRSNFLYVPSLYGIGACVLAVLSVYLDSRFLPQAASGWIPGALFIPLDLSRTILGAISAALLTMTTITFSTILVVLTTYLSEFSPRTLQNFISDAKTQRVLAFFTAGIIYSLLLLLFLRGKEEDVFLSPSLAVFFAIICVFMFVFFIHHVSSWIQVSSLLHYITKDTMEKIEKELPDEQSHIPAAPWEDWESEDIKTVEPKAVRAAEAGYIQHIDTPGLVRRAARDDCIVRINAKVSDYIEQGAPFLSVWEHNKQIHPAHYRPFLTLGAEKSSSDTIELALVKIVEIALRALSPGINDPNTAVACIRNLGKILARLGRKQLPRTFHYDTSGDLRLMMKQPSFSDYLYTSFHQIRQYGFQDLAVLSAALDAFILIADANSDDVKRIIWEFTEYVMEGVQREDLLTLDRKHLNHKLRTLASICGHRHQFQPL